MGRIALTVDATNLDQHIMQVTETIPVQDGENTILLFPKWLPGNHGPTGPLASLAGLVVTADGKPVAWRRDSVDMGAFHIDVHLPAHAGNQGRVPVPLPARQCQRARGDDAEHGGSGMAPGNPVSRRGYYQRDISCAGLGETAGRVPICHAHSKPTMPDGGEVAFKPVPLETLLDSPVLAGRYFSRVDLAPGAVPVHMDVVADRPKDLVIKPEDLQAHRNLVQQATRNFGGHHYDHFDFLFSVSSDMGDIGLEHQRSNEVGSDEDYFTDPQKSAPFRELLPHEYTHSWNGKFMRPCRSLVAGRSQRAGTRQPALGV